MFKNCYLNKKYHRLTYGGGENPWLFVGGKFGANGPFSILLFFFSLFIDSLFSSILSLSNCRQYSVDDLDDVIQMKTVSIPIMEICSILHEFSVGFYCTGWWQCELVFCSFIIHVIKLNDFQYSSAFTNQMFFKIIKNVYSKNNGLSSLWGSQLILKRKQNIYHKGFFSIDFPTVNE